MTNILETEPLPSAESATPKLAGRAAFVTGATRGCGAAIARRLANLGATVRVGYSRNRNSADRFVADLLGTTRRHRAAAPYPASAATFTAIDLETTDSRHTTARKLGIPIISPAEGSVRLDEAVREAELKAYERHRESLRTHCW